MWLFDEEADATNQGDEATVPSSSSSKFTIPVVDCDEKDALEPPAVELDIVEIEGLVTSFVFVFMMAIVWCWFRLR